MLIGQYKIAIFQVSPLFQVTNSLVNKQGNASVGLCQVKGSVKKKIDVCFMGTAKGHCQIKRRNCSLGTLHYDDCAGSLSYKEQELFLELVAL